MIVDILPFRLKLASMDKADIPRCTHQLMKLVLFPSGPKHFFSYSETDREVSLILDETHIPAFPKDTLDVCNVIWRAVQIEAGESGLGAMDVVSQVSKPLADINVSIMQISTYDADFTLLPECDLTRALDCLSKVFDISNNPLQDVGLAPADLQSWEETFPMSPTEVNSLQDALALNASTMRRRQSSLLNMLDTNGLRRNGGAAGETGLGQSGSEDSGIGSEATSGPNSGLTSGHGSHVLDTTLQGLDPPLISSLSLDDAAAKASKGRHPFQVNFPHRLHITSMEHGLMDQLAIRLLESIFFDNRVDRFFSFTQTDTTLSIIMDDATMSLFPDHTLNTQEGDWRLIAIGDGPLGFDECGIVSEFSRPLSESGIGLFYLSTFSSDYIMVNDQDFERAVVCLEETSRLVLAKDELVGLSEGDNGGEENGTAHRNGGHFLRLSKKGGAGSMHSIDTSSLSGVSSDVDPAELSPVSTNADTPEDNKTEDNTNSDELLAN
ncbi:GATS protein-like 3 [Linnemannia exigua]|uniref:GATS protein-like 3 n=1 Tax=Linnemannia exigua TaxID=604196 RepID=A0AAD4DLQ6_9FUNG|nr:GATS protein-like 3 [Linnemannia exigua]